MLASYRLQAPTDIGEETDAESTRRREVNSDGNLRLDARHSNLDDSDGIVRGTFQDLERGNTSIQHEFGQFLSHMKDEELERKATMDTRSDDEEAKIMLHAAMTTPAKSFGYCQLLRLVYRHAWLNRHAVCLFSLISFMQCLRLLI